MENNISVSTQLFTSDEFYDDIVRNNALSAGFNGISVITMRYVKRFGDLYGLDVL